MEDIENSENQPYVDPNEIKRPTSFLKWIENYWYHYKWHTIIGAFFLVLGIVLVVQLIDREKYDIMIVYSGDYMISSGTEDSVLLSDFPSTLENISKAFEELMEDDYNGDGKKNAITHGEYLLSPKRQEELRQAAEDKSIETNQQWSSGYDSGDHDSARENVSVLITTGEAIICLMDTYSYETFGDEGVFARLEDVLGYTPENALDDFGVYLKDTDFGRYFEDAFAPLPDDTVLCIRKKAQVGVGRGFDDVYDAHVDLFCKIFEFEISQ